SRLFLEGIDPDPEGHVVSRRRLGAADEHGGSDGAVPVPGRERYGRDQDEGEREKKRDPQRKSTIRCANKREFHRYFPSHRAADRTGRSRIHYPALSGGY